MKPLIFAYVCFVILTAAVFINSYAVSAYLDTLGERLDGIPDEITYAEEYRAVYRDFEEKRKF